MRLFLLSDQLSLQETFVNPNLLTFKSWLWLIHQVNVNTFTMAALHFRPNAADTCWPIIIFTVGISRKLPEELQCDSFIWQKKERYVYQKGDAEHLPEIFIAREETSTFEGRDSVDMLRNCDSQ